MCALPTSPDPHSICLDVDAPAGSCMCEHTNGEILIGFSEAPPGCTYERDSCACVTCVCMRVHSSPLCQCVVSLCALVPVFICGLPSSLPQSPSSAHSLKCHPKLGRLFRRWNPPGWKQAASMLNSWKITFGL